MTGALASTWYRISAMRPRLRAHAQIHRQVYRGETWYILQDHQSGLFFRVSPAANLMLCCMDGRRTMQQILDIAGKRFGADRPTQDDAVQLLIKLYRADLLHGEMPPDMAELERRSERHRHHGLLTWIRSPMAMRFPLFDPDRFLDRTMPLVRPLFTTAGFVAWLLLVLFGAVLAAMHWPELTENVSDRVFTAQSAILVVVLFPIIKALHELGHAYMAKAGGAEVHELGVMLIVFLPVPYVDASASSAFREPRRRALVGAAGIMVELALAALAMIAWEWLAPGLWRAAAFNVTLIGGVSTLLFNGNPLLRFDGYYVLSDLIQIPNLDTRSKQYLIYLIKRHGFGLHDVESPVQGPGERAWFVCYGIASFVYRFTVMVAIALFVAAKFAIIGAILALWTVGQAVIYPAARAIHYILTSPQLNGRRGRAFAVAGAAAAIAGIVFFGVPMPYATIAEGVVWVPDEAILRSGSEGFVDRLLVAPGAEVAAGQKVIALEDPVAAAQVALRRAQLDVLENRFTAVHLIDRVQSRLVNEEIARARANLARAEQQARDLVVLAPRSGSFVVPAAHKLEGRYVKKGDLLGYVIAPRDPDIRVVVPQADIDLVRQRARAVAVRFTEGIDKSMPARILRETPSSLERAPAPALTQEGGGPILLDPSSPNRDRPLEQFYQVELAVPRAKLARIGGRVFARFDHGEEPIAWRFLRNARQLLLRALNV
ncbi:MAG: peptidase M50 [Xanthobacteraceae bacterium]